MSRTELLRQMQEGRPVLIADVRSVGEYDRGHLPGAIHIPFYDVVSGLREQNRANDEPIVLYCGHGPRAGIASMILHLAGFRNVFALDEHMKGWRDNEFPIETIVP